LSSIKIRALLDTNIFIYAFELPESNSALIIGSLNHGLFEAVITESTFKQGEENCKCGSIYTEGYIYFLQVIIFLILIVLIECRD